MTGNDLMIDIAAHLAKNEVPHYNTNAAIVEDFIRCAPKLVAKLKQVQWRALEDGRPEDAKDAAYVCGAIEKAAGRWWEA